MDITRREALATSVAALVASAASVEAQPSDTASVITNAISVIHILPNAEDDYSLKLVSGDHSKDVTFVRYKGTTALADVTRIYNLLKSITELMGLDT